MRLAWFSPWPPQTSGVAGRSAELVPILAASGHSIDVFVDAMFVRTERAGAELASPGTVRVLSAHDFIWRHARAPYDLPVYQIGNSHLHRYIWPYLFRYPGLAVLHEGRVHHARAEALLSRERFSDYRAEFAWNHPDVSADAADLAILGFEGHFFYQWPMVRSIVDTARMTGVHSRAVADRLTREFPDRSIMHIALGEGPRDLDVAEARRSFRAAHGLAPDAIVFGVHGGLTDEKRIYEILRAFLATLAWIPDARLLLVGSADPMLGLTHQLKELGLTRSVCQVPVADNATFDQSIAASDVTINLRWPTALETSGPWVRSLALGRPTIVIDTEQYVHVPSLNPISWQPTQPGADLEPGAADRAVTVALEIRDLNHCLRSAMRRLGTDPALRALIGRNARAWWEREHTVERMVDDYERAFAATLEAPLPASKLPDHFRPKSSASIPAVLDSPQWQDPDLRDRLAALD